ncbi:glycerol-3-phosphate acyltransferase [Candidatus Solincola tengchongensis]|uniref:glycerol-3-phosphate acyltransferase n=1 Tax=Candidatus Solincola tengchongensis TaxID=2900693 RepID=UPI00257A41EB|nr:glycerol-3-phosphate acyltransferase [Candidatus Solincola tengchongensis]
MEMTWAVLALLGFILGSIPFSVLLARWRRGVDVREYGDGNPGAVNAWRACGPRCGLAAGVLDYLKGALPVGLAHFFLGIEGWAVFPVAVAPLLGSAFSPFLGFRGGKSIAISFGVWTGLLMFEGPLALGLSLAMFTAFLSGDSWSALLGFGPFLVYLLLRRVEGPLLAVWALNTAVIFWKHREELSGPPRLRPYLRRGGREALGGEG